MVYFFYIDSLKQPLAEPDFPLDYSIDLDCLQLGKGAWQEQGFRLDYSIHLFQYSFQYRFQLKYLFQLGFHHPLKFFHQSQPSTKFI